MKYFDNLKALLADVLPDLMDCLHFSLMMGADGGKAVPSPWGPPVFVCIKGLTFKWWCPCRVSTW